MSINDYRSRIIAHRGVHSPKVSKNSIESFRIASSEGFGLETDIRDHQGEIFVSHDPITSSNTPKLIDVSLLSFEGPVALNVKSDGLTKLEVDRYVSLKFEDYFYFDHSVPELLVYLKAELPVAQRVSNLEELRFESIYDIWLDSFEDFESETAVELEILLKSHRVHIVSPELHGKNHLFLWNKIVPLFLTVPNLTICTDLPFEFLAALEGRNV